MTFSPRPHSAIELDLEVALQPSKCGRQLVRMRKPDEPFFYLGDTAWELFHRLDDEEAESYLRNRADKGFNSVMIVILAEHGGLDTPNRQGHWPFIPASESKEGAYVPDITKPNPEYFAFIDRILSLAASLGITVALVPTWGRYVNGGFYQKPILFDESNAYIYGKFLGERYPFHPYILGGDSVRYWNPRLIDPTAKAAELEIYDTGDVWEAMAKGLLEGEHKARERFQVEVPLDYAPLITYHSCQAWHKDYPEASSSAQFPKSEWLTLDCVQTGHWNSLPEPTSTDAAGQSGGGARDLFGHWSGGAAYEPIRKMYNTMNPKGQPRPVIDLEPHYEATHHSFDYSKPIWSADEIRSGAWQAIFAGACGYTYGCNSIWQMHNAEAPVHVPIQPPTTAYTNWYLELDLPGAFSASVLRKFFLSLPNSNSRRPDSTFIFSDTMEPKDGTLAYDKLISGLRSDQWALVHLPYGGEVDVDISNALSNSPTSTYRAWWVDPRSGGKATLDKGEKKSIAEGLRRFVSPTAGSLATDWVLLLESYTV